MSFKLLKYFSVFIIMMLFGCAGSVSKQHELNLQIEIVKLNTWVNLMPGKTNLFYLSGNIRIRNIKNEYLNNLELNEVTLLQDDKVVHVVKPVFYADNGSPHISPGEEKFFTFKTVAGLKILDKLNLNIPLDLKLKFVDGEAAYIYKINNVKIEKVY